MIRITPQKFTENNMSIASINPFLTPGDLTLSWSSGVPLGSIANSGANLLAAFAPNPYGQMFVPTCSDTTSAINVSPIEPGHVQSTFDLLGLIPEASQYLQDNHISIAPWEMTYFRMDYLNWGGSSAKVQARNRNTSQFVELLEQWYDSERITRWFTTGFFNSGISLSQQTIFSIEEGNARISPPVSYQLSICDLQNAASFFGIDARPASMLLSLIIYLDLHFLPEEGSKPGPIIGWTYKKPSRSGVYEECAFASPFEYQLMDTTSFAEKLDLKPPFRTSIMHDLDYSPPVDHGDWSVELTDKRGVDSLGSSVSITVSPPADGVLPPAISDLFARALQIIRTRQKMEQA